MAITKDEYCIRICGGKCCKHLNPESPCPNLLPDNSCGVYSIRYTPDAPEFEIVGWYKTKQKDAKGLPIIKPFVCGTIEGILARNEMPRDMREQCCYANPQVLERDYGTESNNKK